MNNNSKLQTLAPSASIVVGRKWVLDGAGAARFGYALRHPSGKEEFLGKTFAEAQAKLSR